MESSFKYNKFQRDEEKDTWISDLLPVSILQLNHCWYLLSEHTKNLAVKRHWGDAEAGQATRPEELILDIGRGTRANDFWLFPTGVKLGYAV